MFRRVLLVALMVMLPVQGALAASRWLCVAMSQDRPAATAAHSHPSHDQASVQQHVGDHHSPSDGASHGHSGNHSHGDGGCSLCAACTVTVAAPPSSKVFDAVEVTDVRIPSLDVSVPRMSTDGPERPPRTF